MSLDGGEGIGWGGGLHIISFSNPCRSKGVGGSVPPLQETAQLLHPYPLPPPPPKHLPSRPCMWEYLFYIRPVSGEPD